MRVLTGSPQSQRMQNGGGAALVRTVVDRELRRAMRGSCERARTGGAALSTTAARTRGAALAPSAAGRAMNAVWQRPVCQCRLGLRGCRSALPGWSRALRPRSQPARFLPSGGDRQRGPRRGGLAECSALGRRVVPMCNESAIEAPCAAVEGHRLKVRCGHGSATASGRIWRRPPGQLVTAWPAFGARRMQQAGIGADSCAARARPCRDHAPQESRRTRGHPSAWSAALPSWSLGLRFQRKWIRRAIAAPGTRSRRWCHVDEREHP